eukprot:2394637-Rhodomonas_salina.1
MGYDGSRWKPMERDGTRWNSTLDARCSIFVARYLILVARYSCAMRDAQWSSTRDVLMRNRTRGRRAGDVSVRVRGHGCGAPAGRP